MGACCVLCVCVCVCAYACIRANTDACARACVTTSDDDDGTIPLRRAQPAAVPLLRASVGCPKTAPQRTTRGEAMFVPVGIKKLTNVAIVRYKSHGTRFEIACYKNTVLAYRSGFEKDLDNVLQSTQIYANVSKGVFAKDEDLINVFGTSDQEAICVIILQKGELQVSDKERKAETEHVFRDAVMTLVEKCVNPATNRPYPPGMIETALRDIHFSVDPKRSAKQQALEALPKLQEIFPIKRAAMRFKVNVRSDKEQELMGFIGENDGEIETHDVGSIEVSLTFTVDPAKYRAFDKFVKDVKGRLEVVTLAVMEEGTSSGTFDEDTMKSTVKQAELDKAEEALAKMEISRPVVARAAPDVQRRATHLETLSSDDANILVKRGPIAALPEEHESRRERFADIDKYQEGWEVELRAREGSSIVDAVFYSPEGDLCKTYADARRKAMAAAKS